MKLYKTLSLIVLLAVLAAYVYYYEIKGGEEREREKEQAEKLFDFENDSVSSIEIRSALRQFRFERSTDGWVIREPLVTSADATPLNSLLTSMKNMKRIRTFQIENEDLNDYGLVGRSLLILLKFSDSTRDSVWIGDKTPVGSNVFATKGDSLVYTISSATKNNADKDLFAWRDKSVTKVKQAEVREIILKNENGRFFLSRDGSDWNLLEPINTRAENLEVNNLLRKMENGRVKSIPAEQLKYPDVYRLDKPAYELDMYIGESKAHKKLIFSSLEDNIAYGKDDSRPYVFSVDSLFLKVLNVGLYDLRYKKFSEVDRDAVDSIAVTQGDSLITFRKDTSNTWVMGEAQPIKQWKMNSYLSFVDNLPAKKFLIENVTNPIQYGLAKPDRRVELYTNGNKLQELLLVSYQDNRKIAYSPMSQTVAEIEDLKYRNFEIKISDWMDQKPVDED